MIINKFKDISLLIYRMDEIKVIKSSYTEAQKRATKKYRESNKEKVNEQRKKYYLNRKEKDPKFLEYKRIKAKEYYQKKKGLKKFLDEKIEELRLKSKDIDKIEELKNEYVEPVKEELIVEEIPVLDETIHEKKKRKYIKKKYNKTI